MKLSVGLIGILIVLTCPAHAAEKKAAPTQPRAVPQSRAVLQPRAIQQVRPAQQGSFGQRPNSFATPQSTVRRIGSFGTTGGAPAGGNPAQRRAFGTGSAAENDGSENRHFGATGTGSGTRHFGAASAGTHSANSAPRRLQGGRSYAYHGRAFSPFHAERYRWPHGYRYRRYAVGYALPRRFWLRDYFLDNYADYDLDPPPPNFEWVRYGPDVLLVDLNSGAIAEVVYGAFDETAGAPPDEDRDQ
jgi:Ni/Co efflux regulator RcnB